MSRFSRRAWLVAGRPLHWCVLPTESMFTQLLLELLTMFAATLLPLTLGFGVGFRVGVTVTFGDVLGRG